MCNNNKKSEYYFFVVEEGGYIYIVIVGNAIRVMILGNMGRIRGTHGIGGDRNIDQRTFQGALDERTNRKYLWCAFVGLHFCLYAFGQWEPLYFVEKMSQGLR